MWAGEQILPKNRAAYIRDARDLALINGLVLRSKNMANENCVAHIPFTLFPSPFPKNLYQDCLDIQPIVNKLMFKIACDTDFMNQVLRPIAQVDDFTKNLLDINDTVIRNGLAQSIVCCINRSDYMLDKKLDSSDDPLRVRQVEMNAIASGMSSHSCNTYRLHESCMKKYNIKTPDNIKTPANSSLSLVAQGLIDAYDAYGMSSAIILLVNEPRAANFSEHLQIEMAVNRLRPDIKFVRESFFALRDAVRLGPNQELLLADCGEIAVVYFRNCYDPSQYHFDQAWKVRLLLERSKAIKCPSINFHLSGAKKFQQVLNNQARLEKFLSSHEAATLEKVFCKFWSLGSSNLEQDQGYKMAMSDNVRLVLKPQREGGGHNIFGADIKPFVKSIAESEERSQYILMEYIDGPREKNWLLVPDDQPQADVSRLDEADQLVSELGIYGNILADSQSSLVKFNKSAGYLVRSKKFGVNEGGVASGYAGISSLILLSDNSTSDDYTLYYDDIFA